MKKKINLPTLNKKTLNADFVQLWWSDINSDAGWQHLNAAEKSKPTLIVGHTIMGKGAVKDDNSEDRNF